MPVRADAELEITAFEWVPPFAQGMVRDLRARWACEEMGLAYRERLISAVQRPEWYYAEQPWGQVPHLRDGDVSVFESGAVLVYLAEKGGALLPTGAQARTATLSWLFAAFSSIEPWLLELTNVIVFARKERWAELRKPSLVEAFNGRLDRLQNALAQREWLAGDFSIADIAMVTVLRAIPGENALSAYPTLASYVARGTARPAFQQALADQLAPFPQHAPAGRAG